MFETKKRGVYSQLNEFVINVFLFVIPLLDAFGTMLVIAGAGLHPFLSCVLTAMALACIAKVSRTNVKRHINNISERAEIIYSIIFRPDEDAFANKRKRPNVIFKMAQQPGKSRLFCAVLSFACLVTALLFSIFKYQSYYYGAYIYFKHFGFGRFLYPTLTIFSYFAVLPASIFSLFSHLSDIVSSIDRLIGLMDFVRNSIVRQPYGNKPFIYSMSILFMVCLSLDFAMIGFQNLTYKHISFLAICPNSIFGKIRPLRFLLLYVLSVIEILRGLSFVRATIDLFDNWSQKDFSKVDTDFCLSALFVSLLNGYNYSKVNFIPKSFVITFPSFTNQIVNNVKWDSGREKQRQGSYGG